MNIYKFLVNKEESKDETVYFVWIGGRLIMYGTASQLLDVLGKGISKTGWTINDVDLELGIEYLEA